VAVDEDTLDTFHGSFRRCQASAGFFPLFYEKFIGAHPEVAEKFVGVDMRKQYFVLQASLHMVALSSHDNQAAQLYLAKVAERHSQRQLNIAPGLYDVWLNCLIAAVAEVDPRYSPAVERAWREVLSAGIAFMQSRYAAAAPGSPAEPA
jgi:hemoglobin-like flavoprotein